MKTHLPSTRTERSEARLGWAFVAPALAVILVIAFVPLVGTFWESLHLHDLRMPWLGRPFIGLANYGEALGDTRFWRSLGQTAFFTAITVTVELALGLALALALDRAYRGRGLVRLTVLLPWAIPTVVAALVWRFIFESESGIANTLLLQLGLLGEPIVWLVHPLLAWVPIVLADVWKTTPFVALLLLAGLQNIDGALLEAARMDGAGAWRRFREVTLPLLRPALLVALVFRTLDAFRVFDLIFVLTGGGPGTSTEPISLYTFNALLQQLRFGFGSALSVIVFGITFVLALVYIRLLGASITQDGR
jgi:ABC-type sugar transport system permease subunit